MSRILFVTSEAQPLMKTGGLGDVAGSLPPALAELGEDIRIIMPAYRDTLARLPTPRVLAEFTLPMGQIRLLASHLPPSSPTRPPVPVWLVDHPPAFDRPGNPYLGPDQQPWPDNAYRFALFARVVVELSLGRVALQDPTDAVWQPDVVHCHDWQTGLVPVLLAEAEHAGVLRPGTVFTIHNLAYQGLFPYATLLALGLPAHLWQFTALEFHGQLSFIKGGLVYADRLTTVSPTYAEEIQRPEFGFGLDGLLRYRRPVLSGILNGIDTDTWNPDTDPHLYQAYSARNPVSGKNANKRALLKELGLAQTGKALLIGLIGRLVIQKGVDEVLAALPALLERPLQFAVLGSGDPRYEQAWRDWAIRVPGRIGLRIGFDEGLAHRIEAGADLFLMPSHFEPCGLNQLFSLRYATLPLVRPVGGLADTVIDATPAHLAAGRANGFVIQGNDAMALVNTVDRALALYAKRATWRRVQHTAMRQDHSWAHSARAYQALYHSLGATSVH